MSNKEEGIIDPVDMEDSLNNDSEDVRIQSTDHLESQINQVNLQTFNTDKSTDDNEYDNLRWWQFWRRFEILRYNSSSSLETQDESTLDGDRQQRNELPKISLLKFFSCTHLFDRYTKRLGKTTSRGAIKHPRILLIFGNTIGLMFGLVVALGLMKLKPFYLEINGSPNLFVPTESIYSKRKTELRNLFGKDSPIIPVLYSNMGPSGTSLLEYIPLKQIWLNELAIQNITVTDKTGKIWNWDDICHHQPTGTSITGSPCIVVSIFGLFMANSGKGIFTEEDFDNAFTGDCCGGVDIRKFAAGNLIKHAYYPHEYTYDKDLPEWPFGINNTQHLMSIYRLNSTIPSDVIITWENKVAELVQKTRKQNMIDILSGDGIRQEVNEDNILNEDIINHVKLQVSEVSNITKENSNNSTSISEFESIQKLDSEYEDNSNKLFKSIDVTKYPNLWNIIHYSEEYVSNETTELANKETPLLLATFALMILFMAGCISGRFPKRSRIMLSSTVILITIYATVGSFATGMVFGVPISALTPLFIHMLLGIVVSYMIITVRTYTKTKIYLRIPHNHLSKLNPKYVRICDNDVFLDITQYIYRPWKGFFPEEPGAEFLKERRNMTTLASEQTISAEISLDDNFDTQSIEKLPKIESNEIQARKVSDDNEIYKDLPNTSLEGNKRIKQINGTAYIASSIEIDEVIFEINGEKKIINNDLDSKNMWDNEVLLYLRLVESGSVVFSSITLTCLTSCAALFLGTVVDFPIVRYYCIHAGFGIMYLFMFHWLIFLPSFVLDERRIFKRKCDILPFIRFRWSEKKSNYLFLREDISNLKVDISSNEVNETSQSKLVLRSFIFKPVFRVRRGVIRKYKKAKNWWNDRSALNKDNLHANKLDKSSSINDDEDISDIDMKDIWIGRLMVESSKVDLILRIMCSFTFRVFACLFFLIMVTLGIIYGRHVNTEFSAEKYLPPSSPLHYFEETLANSWGSEARPMFVVLPGSDKVDWSDRQVRKNFINLVDNILAKDPAITGPLISWVHDYEAFFTGNKYTEDPNHIYAVFAECTGDVDIPEPVNAPKSEYYKFLENWRNQKVIKDDQNQDDTICTISYLNTKHTPDNVGSVTPFLQNVIPEMHDSTMLIFNPNPEDGIQISRILLIVKYDPNNSQYNYETLTRLNNLIDVVFNKQFPGTYIYSDWFAEAERDSHILSIVWKLLLYVTLGVSIILCIIQNPLTGIFIGLVVGGIDIIVILCMYITGLIFDIVAFMVLVTAVSFSIEYVVHITHLFLITDRDNGVERIKDSLLDMGPNVLYAAISTFLGIVLLAFATSEAFKVFLWITTIVLCVSAITGIIIAPALLSILYDFGNFVTSYWGNKKKSKHVVDFHKEPVY
ncbi:patched family protein [Cryptosporidium andersoni]|uniref:Patched family protein n=1 Tax=Cryptosporidium andersoni TaxID=117008 RepID=A0A1J4MM19_9CRYT|nr:patched family protein [Cryptosporidium andersoni]